MRNSRCKIATKIFGGGRLCTTNSMKTSCMSQYFDTYISYIFGGYLKRNSALFWNCYVCLFLYQLNFSSPLHKITLLFNSATTMLGPNKKGSHSSVTQAVWTWCFDIQQFIWVNWVTFCCVCQISDPNKIMPSCAVLRISDAAAAGKCRPRKMTNFERVSPACFL